MDLSIQSNEWCKIYFNQIILDSNYDEWYHIMHIKLYLLFEHMEL